MNLSKQFSLREKILLLILAILALLAAYYFAVHRPVTETIEKCAIESDELNTEITILSAKKQKKDDMLLELEQIKASGDTAVVPDYDNLDRIVAFLNNVLSNTENYSLSVSGVVKAEDSSGIVRRSMVLKFTCPDYNSAKEAINKLQNSSFCCRLGAMTFSRSGEQSSRSILEGPVAVTINITFFEHINGKG